MGAATGFLARETAVLGLPMWGVIGALIGAAVVLVMCVTYLWIKSRRTATFTSKPQNRDIERDTRAAVPQDREEDRPTEAKGQVAPAPAAAEVSQKAVVPLVEKKDPTVPDSVRVESGKGQMVACPKSGDSTDGGSNQERQAVVEKVSVPPECSYYGWGHWYTLKELHDATGGFSASNVIGQGGYGVVYHGVTPDQTQIAVKNLLNNREQADREFRVEVEAIGRVRHKNLVKLIGYCAEGTQRLLVYEYLDNGNLEQWLHGDVGPVSPLTWEIRVKIILGTARGLMYLHEGLEPKVVHRDIKASNILLDKQWNAKVSDFGLAKFLGSERTYVTTRVMGTFGYVAPEYASTGMLNESSDVYSFGILIMQIISGRTPVDYSRPPGEVNLVEWLKVMVSNRNSDGVLDPKLPEAPDSRALKKALLVALRCVDPDSTKRPKMSHAIHMLEVDDFPYPERRVGGPGRSRDRSLEKQPTGSGVDKDSPSILSANGTYRWRRQEK